MTQRVLGAWQSYLEGLQYYNTIGQAAGELRTKSRSLPKGDSWSTRALAAMLGIWARRYSGMEATPRFLVDDMFVWCEAEHPGSEHVEDLADKVDAVIEETLHVIRNIGGDAQLHKCAILASDDKLRKRNSGERPGDPSGSQYRLPVDIRDLGSHVSCGKRPTSKTLKDRVKASHCQ